MSDHTNHTKYLYDVEEAINTLGFELSTKLQDCTYDMIDVVAFYVPFIKGEMLLEDIVEAIRSEVEVLDEEEEDEDRNTFAQYLLTFYTWCDMQTKAERELIIENKSVGALSDDESCLMVSIYEKPSST